MCDGQAHRPPVVGQARTIIASTAARRRASYWNTLASSTMPSPSESAVPPRRVATARSRAGADSALGVGADATAQDLAGSECIAPSKPGAVLILIRTLASRPSPAVRPPLRHCARYLPGGIGAVAFDRAATGRLDSRHALVAFSSGSLLNIAQRPFWPATRTPCAGWPRWAIRPHGVVAVPPGAPFKPFAVDASAARQN